MWGLRRIAALGEMSPLTSPHSAVPRSRTEYVAGFMRDEGLPEAAVQDVVAHERLLAAKAGQGCTGGGREGEETPIGEEGEVPLS